MAADKTTARSSLVDDLRLVCGLQLAMWGWRLMPDSAPEKVGLTAGMYRFADMASKRIEKERKR